MKHFDKISKAGLVAGILFISLLIIKTGYSQSSALNKEIFGIGYSFESSRLLSTRMFIEGNYTVGRRTFEVGITPGSYNTDGQGFMFKHKVYLNRKKKSYLSFNLKNHKIRTFAIYKFIMFSSSTKTLRKSYELEEKDPFVYNYAGSPTINTIEHYLGLGFEFKIADELYAEAMGVGGINFIKNNSEVVQIEDKLLPKADLDISWDLSIGLNYRF